MDKRQCLGDDRSGVVGFHGQQHHVIGPGEVPGAIVSLYGADPVLSPDAGDGKALLLHGQQVVVRAHKGHVMTVLCEQSPEYAS